MSPLQSTSVTLSRKSQNWCNHVLWHLLIRGQRKEKLEELRRPKRPILDELDRCFEGLVKGVRVQLINLPGTAYHHALQCRKKFMAIFRAELENKKGNGSEDDDDLMDGLMRIKDEHGETLCDDEVLDNIVSLVLAGFESTSLALMWALYYLTKYPDVLQKLRVVEETIRMANIAAFTLRLVSQDIEYKGN
ncbi:hypothetical protein GIB67_037319 [Kingdonia uniflora]|uniref:Uncharacterized protein n=1 Tax=Kingdonia uniflora TaxID=39325 RepID=A0A7J7MS87_9MAGN|nr:hypothetical protein GIB67_037319 [Kingdonia uniflora]